MTAARFARLLLFLALAFVLAGAGADGDLWGHVRFGQDLLATHHLATADTYSFTADKPWVNHEWLAEAAMAWAFAVAGPLGLNLLRIACLAGIAALIWRRLSSFKMPARTFDVLLVVAMLGVYVRAQQVRPQMFSLLLFALLLLILTDVDRTGDRRRLLLIPPLMAVWANLHGGWIVGAECLAVWTGFALVVERGLGSRLLLAAVALAAVGATALNPYGTGLWTFLFETVRVGRAYVEDWQPVYRLQPWVWLFWLLPAIVAAAAAIRSRLRVPPAYAAIVLFLGASAFMVNRLDAFFMLAVVFLLGKSLAGSEQATSAVVVRETPRRSLAIAAVVVVVAAAPVLALRVSRIPIGHPPMPEREAADFVAERELRGDVLVWFDWGEYVIWHFSPHLRVSIDGRRETVYSDRVVDEHMAFYLGDGDAADLPTRIAADYVWIPKWLPVVPKLRARGWTSIFEGPQSIILSRRGAAAAPRVASAAIQNEARSFPGP